MFIKASKTLSHPKYRPDIDGLRAIAVLSVVAYHAFPNLLVGGFTGVDVFFVISGYLISTIIFENLEKDTFSFFEFYARRIKRIFPAVFVVLFASFVFGWFALMADEYKQLGGHIAAGAGFASNLVQWKNVNYFSNSSQTQPLMHLWSLGVEEQFYIIWPLLLWAAYKCKFNIGRMLAFGIVASFILNIYWIVHSSKIMSSFFLPQARFWELLSGSLLALINVRKDEWLNRIIKIKADWIFNIFSFVGLFLLLCGFKLINSLAYIALPVFGSVLLILAGPKTWINRVILSNSVVIWFGLISFPLYLWHWPLLSFARIIEGEVPSLNIRITCVIASIILAFITYKFVERPIRLGGNNRIKVAVLVVLMIVIGCAGYYSYSKDGLISRFNKLSPEHKSKIFKIAEAWKFQDYPNPQNSFIDVKYKIPRIGSNDKNIILLQGDSHARQYWNGMANFCKTEDVNNADKPAVMLWLDMDSVPSFNQNLMIDPSIKTVVFSYYWAYKYRSEKVKESIRCCGIGKDGSVGAVVRDPLSANQMDDIDKKFIEIAKFLKSRGKKVYFILDNPFGKENDPHSMLYRSWTGIKFRQPIILKRDVALARSEPIRSRILRIAKESRSSIIDPFGYLCDKNICPAFFAEGELLYKDYDHLSLLGAINIPYLRPFCN